MAVRVRLKKRFKSEGFDIIATSNGQHRGKTLDVLGMYSPIGKEKYLRINVPRLTYWVDNGGKCSEAVLKLIKIYNECFKRSTS